MYRIRFFREVLTLLCLLAISLSRGQTINTTYRTQINAKFAGLDKTKVPNKLLINQAMEFAELSDYKGVFTSTNFTTKGKYTGIYNTLLMSRVATNVTGLVSPTTFRNNWDNLRQPNTIVLSGLFYKYSKFRTDAYPNYLVNNNGVITDKYTNGVWQNPYIDQDVFAIAAPILVYKSLSLQVTLPASLWYTNQSSAVQSIAIDFGDGAGYQSMTLGQVRTITYTQSQTYEWKYKLTLQNNQVLYSHSKLKVDVPVEAPPVQDTLVIMNSKVMAAPVNPPPSYCPNIVVMPFSGTRQYLGVANSATLQIKYAQRDCKIRKPLIVVEGFDSGLLGIENAFGESDYISFINNVSKSFSSSLRSQIDNFDIIYINFNQGRDDLKRNAYLVEDIIKWVNDKKASVNSTTPNVVIGQSMGGVIARYALRDMEILNQAHQTRLFVSHDAPQQGANIPLGIQYFARHLANQFIGTPVGDYSIPVEGASISMNDIQGLLDAQGTKQLLANTIDSSFNLNNAIFNAFQTELRNLGYPTQTRNVALSNGNHCANPQEFNPSATLFNLSGNANTTALTTTLMTLIQPITGASFAALSFEMNEPGLLLGMLPGSSSFAMNFYAKALPTAGTNNEIYYGKISYTKKIFSLFGWDPQITVDLTQRSYNNPVNLSYDYYPGGKYRLPLNFNAPETDFADWIALGINVYMIPSFNFIPVTSALDIGRGSVQLTNADYLKKYNSATPPTAPKDSPFVNFTTSFTNGASINEEHISFNKRNGNWLATELDTNVNNNDLFDCTYICPGAQIIGASTLCVSSTYSAPSLAMTYNWTITRGSGIATISGNGTQTVTLTQTGNLSGEVTLSLTIGDPNKCGTSTLTKNIWVGVPVFGLVRGTAQSETCDIKYHYVPFTIKLPEDTSLDFLYLNPGVTVEQTGNAYENIYTFRFLKNFNGYLNVIARATNSCGSYFYETEGGFLIRPCGYSGLVAPSNTSGLDKTESFYRLYPNPSTSVINVELKDANVQPALNTKISATLYNMMNEPKGNVQITNNIASLNVSGLPQGVYILKINIDGVIENHQVIVN